MSRAGWTGSRTSSSNIHKRIDDLDGHLDKQDGKVELDSPASSPARCASASRRSKPSLRGRLDEVDEGVHEHLDGTREALQKIVADVVAGMHGRVDETA